MCDGVSPRYLHISESVNMVTENCGDPTNDYFNC